jgi:large subunit ribosomal protein L30
MAKQNNANAGGKIRIQYYRSFIAFPKTQKEIVRSLGLTKLNQVVERPDTPAARGVVAKVPHLLRIIE